MRVTDRQQVDALITAIRGLRGNLFDRTEQISSGKRVNRPSDDPAAMERIQQFRNVLQTTDHRLSTVNEGIGRLNFSDGTLEQAVNIIGDVQKLAEQMKNDSYSASDRKNAAMEVQQRILELAGLANTQLNGRFIFAGSQTQTEPYVPGTATGTAHTANTGSATVGAVVATPSALQPNLYQIQFTSANQFDVINLTTNQTVSAGNTYTSGAVFSFDGLDVTITNGGTPPQDGDQFFVRVGYSYQGDGETVPLEIGDGRVVNSNVPGDQVFSGPATDLFQDLQNFHQALVTNDTDGIGAAINNFDRSRDQITAALADVGARVNRLITIQDGLDLLSTNTQTLRSRFEDADIAKVASELATLQTTLEASLATLTRQFETSLLNYLQ